MIRFIYLESGQVRIKVLVIEHKYGRYNEYMSLISLSLLIIKYVFITYKHFHIRVALSDAFPCIPNLKWR